MGENIVGKRRRKSVKKAESLSRLQQNPRPKNNLLPLDDPESADQIKVQQMDLCEIYWNRKNAIQDWCNFMINTFGIIPDEIVVNRSVHDLMFIYLCARGTIAAGNWLGLELSVSYDYRFGVDDMLLYDQWTGSEIVYGGGSGIIIQFAEKDILRRRNE